MIYLIIVYFIVGLGFLNMHRDLEKAKGIEPMVDNFSVTAEFIIGTCLWPLFLAGDGLEYIWKRLILGD